MKWIKNGFRPIVNFIFIMMLFGFLLSKSAEAQNANLGKAEMQKMTNWVGEWQGEGWSMDESRQRVDFTIREHIQSKLGGLALLIEGFGKNKSDGKPSHTALAMMYFNKDKGHYEMKSLIERGMATLAVVKFDDKGDLTWGFPVQGGDIKYTITLTADTWVEKGAFVMAGGQEFPIMEMSLKKVK